MINKKLFYITGHAGFVFGAGLLLMLTGCVGYVDGPRAGVYVAPPVVEVGVPADYVYYPAYGVYYSGGLGLYGYMDGGVWVSRPQPVGVSVDVLLASPSVRMDFHDSPANHYAAMSRQYPRNWSPYGAHQGQNAQSQKAQVAKAQVAKAPVPKPQVKKAPQKQEKHEEK